MKTNKIDSHQIRLLTGILLILLIGFIVLKKTDKIINQKTISNNAETIINNNSFVFEEINELEKFLTDNETTLVFYANVFQINIDKLHTLLIENNDKLNLLNTSNLDATLIDFLLNLEKSNKQLFSNKITSCKENKTYIVALINYFTKKIGTVDFKTAAAIAKVESGFTAKGMLKANNIFGGLVNGKLIKYRNIEYGVLRYVKLLKDGYYDKGLTTVENIGEKYNPVNINGKKVASPSWVGNTKLYIKSFDNYNDITSIEQLNSLKTTV